MPASIASLDSSRSSDDDWELEEERRRLDQELEESVEELQKLLSFVLLPFLGKFLGRRWSQWAFERYTRLGLGKSFFLGMRPFAFLATARA